VTEAEYELACVALDSRLGKMRDLFERNANRVFEIVRKSSEAAAKHDCGVDLLRIFLLYKLGRFDRVFVCHKYCCRSPRVSKGVIEYLITTPLLTRGLLQLFS